MAQVPNRIIYCSILLLASSCACQYIELPFQELDYGMRDTGRLYLALKSLPLKSDSSPKSVLDKLREFRDKSDNNLDKEDMNKLIGLADKGDECSYGQYELFVKSWLTLKRTETIENARAILDFLMHYGRSKYSRCAKRVLAEFEGKLKRNAADLGEIFRFFRAALGIARDSSSETILQRLIEFDLAESDVDMDKLASISEEDLTDESGVAARVRAKLSQTCDRLVRSFDMDFNVLNLAMMLNHPNGQDYFRDSAELQMLNEVHRICLQRESNKSQVYENLERQVEPRHSLMFPLF